MENVFGLNGTDNAVYFEFVDSENATANNSSIEGNYDPLGVGPAAFIATVTTFALVGNLLVFLAATKRQDAFPTNLRYLACSIAVSDFISGFFFAFSVYPATLGYWLYSSSLCTVQAIIIDINEIVVFTTLAYVSIDRYLCLVSPHGLVHNGRFCGIFICLIWAVPIVWKLTIYSTGQMRIVYAEPLALCSTKDVISTMDRVVIVLVCAVLTWVFLIKALHTVANQVPPEASELVFRTLLTLTILQYLPLLPQAFLAFNHWLTVVNVPDIGKFWIVWIENCNTFLDFVIYSLMQKSFRQALKSVCRDSVNFVWRHLTGHDFFGTPVVAL